MVNTETTYILDELPTSNTTNQSMFITAPIQNLLKKYDTILEEQEVVEEV